MRQYDRIPPSSSAEDEEALQRALDTLPGFEMAELQEQLDAHNFVQKCRRTWESDARTDRVEVLLSEGAEFAAAPIAGALAAWRTKGGFPIGRLANWVIGGTAKAVSIGLASKLPDFESLTDAPPPAPRILRSLARAGKVFLYTELSMMTRDAIEDDQ